MMLIVARAPVARVGRAALAEPLRAFVIGLAAEIFFVPLLDRRVDRPGDHDHRHPVRGRARADRDRDRGVRVRAGLHRARVPHRRMDRRSPWLAAGQRIRRDGDRLRRAAGADAAGALRRRGLGRRRRRSTFLLMAIGLTVEFLAWTMGLGAAIITGLGRWYTVPPPITCSRRSNRPQRYSLLSGSLTRRRPAGPARGRRGPGPGCSRSR